MSGQEQIYTPVTRELAEQRKSLAPKPAEAFKGFSQSVFAEGALSAKTKQLIAVAVAHVTQCPYCIRRGQTEAFGQDSRLLLLWRRTVRRRLLRDAAHDAAPRCDRSRQGSGGP